MIQISSILETTRARLHATTTERARRAISRCGQNWHQAGVQGHRGIASSGQPLSCSLPMIQISSHITGNHVFRSTNEGNSWQIISPDLTRNDSSRLEASGVPITKDNTGAEYYGTIFAFAESPCQRGLFWAGSDDGLIYLSRDDGETWEPVRRPNCPNGPGLALLNPLHMTRRKPMSLLYATGWTISRHTSTKHRTMGKRGAGLPTGIAERDITRVIRADPV